VAGGVLREDRREGGGAVEHGALGQGGSGFVDDRHASSVRARPRRTQCRFWTCRYNFWTTGAGLALKHVPMPDYGRFCPVALATDVLADRWTPMIVRELVLGNTRFNDIARGLPGISRSLLSQRLRHLEKRGVVERWPVPAGRARSTTSRRPARTSSASSTRWAAGRSSGSSTSSTRRRWTRTR
jgi:DNA-binding HxlR family transcriptional regulator